MTKMTMTTVKTTTVSGMCMIIIKQFDKDTLAAMIHVNKSTIKGKAPLYYIYAF